MLFISNSEIRCQEEIAAYSAASGLMLHLSAGHQLQQGFVCLHPSPRFLPQAPGSLERLMACAEGNFTVAPARQCWVVWACFACDKTDSSKVCP